MRAAQTIYFECLHRGALAHAGTVGEPADLAAKVEEGCGRERTMVRFVALTHLGPDGLPSWDAVYRAQGRSTALGLIHRLRVFEHENRREK